MIPTANPRPSASITAAAAERAAAWLVQAWNDRDADDPGLAVGVLALSHLCRLLCGSAVPGDIDKAVAHAVPEPAWAASNMLTCLTAAVGAVCEKSDLAASAERYLGMLGELESELDDSANATLVRLALHGSDRPVASRIAAPSDVLLLRGNPAKLQQFLSEIEMSSRFGTAPVVAEPPSCILLEGIAIAAFRAYDLPLAMRLMRARLYIGDCGSAGVRMGIHFLKHSQCDDGSFGDYDSALAHMAARGHRDGPLQIKLPVTLQALWTLAELEDPNFRLVRSAFLDLNLAGSRQQVANVGYRTN
jgi:hypothetical protein